MTSPQLHSRNLAPILRGEQREGHEALFFEREGGRAVAAGDWKLVAPADGGWELYHLMADATEARNVAAEEPEWVADLAGRWRDWVERVGAPISDDP